MSKLEKYLSKSDKQIFKNLRKDILENEIKVTCVGLYNSGKSTLLNVLIDDFEFKTFKTADIRETNINKRVSFNNITYIDTPGLNANEEDDKKVMEVIQQSDITLFVHNVTTGEFDKNEIDFLKKIQKYWNTPQEFIDRTIFILSRIDNIYEFEDIEKTSNRMKEEIYHTFKSNCLIIPISAIDYRDGIVEYEDELIEDSNLNELKKKIYILSEKFKEAILKTKKKRFKDKIDELSTKLNKKIEINKLEINKLREKQKEIDKAFKKDIEKIESTLKNMYQRLENIGKERLFISSVEYISSFGKSFFCQRCDTLIIFNHTYCDDCLRERARDKAKKEAKEKRNKSILLDINSYKKQEIISMKKKYNSTISFEQSTLEYKQAVFICNLNSTYKIKIVSKNNDIQNIVNFLKKEDNEIKNILTELEIIKNETL